MNEFKEFYNSVLDLQTSALRVSIAIENLKMSHPNFDFSAHEKFISTFLSFSRINIDALKRC